MSSARNYTYLLKEQNWNGQKLKIELDLELFLYPISENWIRMASLFYDLAKIQYQIQNCSLIQILWKHANQCALIIINRFEYVIQLKTIFRIVENDTKIWLSFYLDAFQGFYTMFHARQISLGFDSWPNIGICSYVFMFK